MAVSPKDDLAAKHPLSEYRKRIDELRGYAAADGFDMAPASADDFCRFIVSTPGMRRAMLTLDENGCLRAHWADDAVGQVGIEFLGDGATEFALIREPDETWDAGKGDFAEAKERVKAFGLGELVGV